MTNSPTVQERFAVNGKPKRILALDGGGVRGVVSLAFLGRIEALLRQRFGDSFLLCEYFDLMAGTSTGAIIAAALAKGWTVADLKDRYFKLASDVFKKSTTRAGVFRASYDQRRLSAHLKKLLEEDVTMGSSAIKTGLLIVTKRLDTGSPWPISNNPRGRYFGSSPDGVIANGEYPLWKVVRASSAAPKFFDPERITIADRDGQRISGMFVDGGVSPHNNPALQALMFATLDGFRVGWPVGADQLLLISVGTGLADPEVQSSSIAARHGINALLSLMNDCTNLVETMMQWMSEPHLARVIDSEIGDLAGDFIGGAPLITYRRYNIDLQPAELKRLDETLPLKELKTLGDLDAPGNMQMLFGLAEIAAAKLTAADLPAVFDPERRRG